MLKWMSVFLVLCATARAGLPPTTSKLSGDSSNVTTFNFDFPAFTGSHSGSTATIPTTTNATFNGLNLGDLTGLTPVVSDASKNLASGSVSSPLTFSAGAFGCQTASGSQAGCLSSTDWSTFNGKQATGNYATSGSGDVSWSAPVGAGPVTTSLIATSNSTLTTLPNLGLPYSQLTGAVPTWNQNTTGNAATATALASAPTTCTSGQVPTGVDVHGNATGCAAPTVSINNDAQTELLSPNTLTFPNNKVTANGIGSARIDDGDNNLLANRSFEASTTTTNWTTVKNTGTSFAASTDSTNFHDGLKSVKLTATTATGCISQDVTPSVQLSGTNMEFGAWVKTSGTDVQVCAREGAATIGTCSAVPSTNQWTYVPVNYPGPASGSVGVSVCNTTSNTETFNVDEAYVGEARNLSQVAQAQLIGQVKITGCSGAWQYNTTSFAAPSSSPTGCAYSASGNAESPSANTIAIKFASLPPGNYTLVYAGNIGGNSGYNGTFQFTDGTNVANETATCGSGGTATSTNCPGFQQTIAYSSSQSNITLSINGNTGNASFPAGISSGVISVYYLPSQTRLALTPNTSPGNWSGTSTLSGTTTSTTDADIGSVTGAVTTSASSNISCAASGFGVSCTLPAPGQYHVCAYGYMSNGTATAAIVSELTDGSNAVVWPDQVGTSSTANAFVPFGGCNNYQASSTSASFKVRGNVSGSTGTFNLTAISVTSLNAGMTAPILVGSVTSSGAGQYHTEGATVSCGSSSSVTSSSGPWLTIANILSNSCAISFTSGEFSAAPWCTLGSVDGNSSLTYNSKLSSQATTSGMSIMTTYTNGSSVSVASPATVNISCFGPH